MTLDAQSERPGGQSERLIVPKRSGNADGGKEPYFECAFNVDDDEDIDVSLSSPDKIRKLQRKLYIKAKEEPEFRFYALYDKVYREDILAEAYRRVRRNGGSAGVDSEDFADIESQGRREWLSKLRRQLREKTYKPAPVKRVMIPKPGGGQRPLGVPTIRDRTAQMAAKIVLEPIFEADFEDCAYGYRPNRSAQDAVEAAHEAICEGHTDVVDADLASYFDTIPHDQLMKSVARRVSDGAILHLIKMWLKAPIEERDDDGNRRLTGGKSSTRGTPQGGVLSPLLANIYMHRYLRFWSQQQMGRKFDARIVSYADDFVMLTKGRAEEALTWTSAVMEAIGLSLNEHKTCIRDATEESFDFLGYTLGPEYYRKGGRWFLSAKPSKKAVQRLKAWVRQWLSHTARPWQQLVQRLNRVLRGWARYFSYGSSRLTFRAIDQFVYERVIGLLSKRHKLAGRGTRRWPAHVVHGELGVVRLVTYQA